MGKKNVLGVAAAVLAGAALSGCQSSRPQTSGPLMSGVPTMSGAAANQNMANTTGLAQNQNQTGQVRPWNDRSYTNNMTGQPGNAMVPAAGATYPYSSGTQSGNTRTSTGTMDRGYPTPSTSSGTTSYSRPGTAPSYSSGSATPSYSSGSTTGYPRPATTSPGSDRMLTNPSAPSYPSTSYGSTMQGGANQSGTSKPTSTTNVPPAPLPVSSTSPTFGSSSGQTGSAPAPTFTPQGGASSSTPNSSVPPVGSGNE